MRSAFVLIAVTILLQAAAASAQCPDVGGSPQAEQYAANKVRLKYLITGPGGGDDRPELYKSLVSATLPSTFNPTATHSVRVRLLLNGNQGQVMSDLTIPPNGLWVQTGMRWDFFDPAVTFGVRKARILDLGNTAYLIVRWQGRNQNIANAPVVPGVDNVTAEVEIFDGSNLGVCYDGSSSVCAGGGNTQTCKVQ